MTLPVNRWVAGALLAFSALAVAALINPIARRLHKKPRFSYSQGALGQADYAKLAQQSGWGALEIQTEDRIALKGLVRKPTQPESPWIVFFPGNDFAQLRSGQEFLTRLNADRDWGLAAFSYRGYDSNPGDLKPERLASDALLAYRTLLERERLQPSRVHLVAFSLGGFAATTVYGKLARTPECPASLSLLASVRDIEMFHESWLSKFVAGDNYTIVHLLDSISRPVLVVNGGKDTALGVEHGRSIAAQLGEHAKYVELPEVSHESMLHDPTVTETVRQWVETAGEQR